jgi:CheY-like chemotaxis protein
MTIRPKKTAVLIAEDDKFLRFIAQKQLQRLGYEVDLVEDGSQAVEAVSTAQYSLVFMDLHMPILDGLEAVRKIRLFESQNSLEATPIVAMTADPNREQCIAAGMQDYMRKPVLIEDLEGMLRAHATK